MFAGVTRCISVAAICFVSVPGLTPSGFGTGTANAAMTVDGIIHVKSAYGVEETFSRLKADIAAKSITFFTAVNQSQLAVAPRIAIVDPNDLSLRHKRHQSLAHADASRTRHVMADAEPRRREDDDCRAVLEPTHLRALGK
jgi:hypothetical protein